MPTLIIQVEFSDPSDFDFYRTKFVSTVEDEAADATDLEEDGKADGTIEVSWEVED